MSKLSHELDKLRIFVAVAEKGKINEASEILHLTQPSITRAVQKLEEAFGSKIFIRSRDGVRLTQAGQMLYDYASRILRGLDDIEIRSQNIHQDLSGKLSIGTYDSLAEYLWPDFLFQLQKSNPSLHLSIKTSLNRNPLNDLSNGQIDLLVDAEPQTRSELVSWPLYSDKFGFYVSTEVKEKSLSRMEISNRNIIYVEKAFDENRISIEEHLERAGHQFARHHCFDSFSTVKRLAMRGMGIAVLPIRLAEEDIKKKLLRPLLLEGFHADGFGKHTIYATVADENKKDVRVKKIVTLLKNHFQ